MVFPILDFDLKAAMGMPSFELCDHVCDAVVNAHIQRQLIVIADHRCADVATQRSEVRPQSWPDWLFLYQAEC